MERRAVLLLASTALALVGGCQLLLGVDSGNPRGTGGAGGSTTTSNSSGTTSASSSGTSSSSGTTSASSSGASSSSGATSSSSSSTTGSSSSSTTSSSSSGATSSSSASSASSSSSAASSSSSSGGVTARMLLLAVNGSGSVTSALYDGSTWAAPVTVSGTASTDDLSLAVIPVTGPGVGLLHGTSNQLVYTLWTGSGWSTLAQINADTTQGRPALAASGSTVHAVFWGNDFKYYYEAFSGGAWTTTPQAVVPMGMTLAMQPCGPSPGVLAPLGTDVALIFVNGGNCSGATNHLYDTDLSSGVWQTSKDITFNPSFSSSQRPAVTAPGAGTDLVTAYIEQGGSQIASAVRKGGTWTTPAPVPTMLTNDPVALAPLAGGGALVAYRGTDMKLYTSTFSVASWSNPVAALTSNPTLGAAPVLIAGIGTAVAEMVYIDSTGALFHTRLMGSTWSAPVQVAPGVTGFVHAAIAGGP